MPCRFFEPLRPVGRPQHAAARMPLIEEYEGVCRAGAAPMDAPLDLRFACCNQGNSRGACPHFPLGNARGCLRYTVAARSSSEIELMVIEESEYAPVEWRPVHYFIAQECLEPEIADLCTRAQLVAFCRSFLKRFPN
jgi:hypothetical protein